MKVALIHDHLAQDGGAEQVLKVLAGMFPDAPIYTLLCEPRMTDKYFRGRRVETSIIQRLPGGVSHYKWYMPFMPMAVEFFDLSDFDLVISDASAFAKGVITAPQTLHICYCHTPTRYLWSDTHQYINELKYNKYFKKIISLVLNYVRIWDRQAADRVDKFIANSRAVQKRIKKYYRRDSIVIYPPVETDKFFVSRRQDDYFLIGGRLAPYKRVDIVIEAFKKMGRKLKIFGDGVDRQRLQKIAGQDENIEFLGRVDDKTKAELYSHCQAFLNPQEEDFGITMVEAMAAGRPILAFNRGGALEIVQAGKSGEFFSEQTPAAIIRAVENFDAGKYNPEEIRAQARQFDASRFKESVKEYIEMEWEEFNSHNA